MPTAQNLEDLAGLSKAQLQEEWQQQIGGKKPPPHIKGLLLRDLVWHAQRNRGVLDAATRKLLNAAMREARTAGPRSDTPRPKSKRHAATPKLLAGTKLIRRWKGRDHEVTVLEDGATFAYAGQSYRSLTQIAEQITGAHWSGPRFFGLKPTPTPTHGSKKTRRVL